LFYSDGVEDQLNALDQEFSRLRVARYFEQHGSEPLKTIVDTLFAEIDEFRGATPITDDQTVVVIRVGP
jgi:serine phosphatase RsbU (regulator of sigma subunit)